MTNEERALELAHKINRRVCGIGTDTALILAYADEIRRECIKAIENNANQEGLILADDAMSAIMGKELKK